jgi:ribosomal protein S18 acetylase RimI-like enzyme
MSSQNVAADARILIDMPMAIAITVRRAREDDAERVSACLESAFAPYRPQYTCLAYEDTVPSPYDVLERMRNMAVYVASVPECEVVATLGSSVHGKEGHLRGMAVLPAWQGHFIADHLLRAVEEDLMEGGCERLTLGTTLPLERAIRFYERNGFLRSGRVTDFHGMPLHEFVKPLPSRRP